MFSLLAGEIGVDPIEVMYELSVADAELIIHGYRQRQLDAWLRTQRVAYVVAQCNSKKKISPDKIVDLSLFESTIFDESVNNQPEEDNVAGDIREHMSEVLKSYSQIIQTNNTQDGKH